MLQYTPLSDDVNHIQTHAFFLFFDQQVNFQYQNLCVSYQMSCVQTKHTKRKFQPLNFHSFKFYSYTTYMGTKIV